MLRNSFKFLSLALAASLTVAPISAIGWGNSDSSRLGLVGLGFGLGVFTTLAGIMLYNYYSAIKKPIKQARDLTREEKEKLYGYIIYQEKESLVNFTNQVCGFNPEAEFILQFLKNKLQSRGIMDSKNLDEYDEMQRLMKIELGLPDYWRCSKVRSEGDLASGADAEAAKVENVRSRKAEILAKWGYKG